MAKVIEIRRKKEAQQMRLVNKEFPWLWGVRTQWCLYGREIKAHTINQDLENFLRRKCKSRHTQVWVRCGLRGREAPHHFDCVVKVKPSNKVSWAYRARRAMPNWSVLSIVVIVVKGDMEMATVYYEKEKYQIDRLLGQIDRSS